MQILYTGRLRYSPNYSKIPIFNNIFSTMNIKQLKKDLEKATKEYELIDLKAQSLRAEFKANFRPGVVPLFLYRNPQAGEQLHWRRSTAIKGLVGDKIKTNYRKKGVYNDFYKEVASFAITKSIRLKLYEFELKKININHQLSITKCHVERLKLTINSLQEWELHSRENTSD